MKIIELVIDEEDFYAGIDAISIVENPAIEENFVALKNQKKYEFAEVDKDKRLLAGPVLIPNKMIYRQDREDEYYIHFTKDTVRRASEMFLQQGNQNNSTLEHAVPLKGLSLVESWIIDDKENDKANMYNMNLPVGTWMGVVKVYNEDIWQEYVKTGLVKGFSIEGYFVDKAKKKEELEQIEAGKQLLEENGSDCGTQVGWTRARQLANKEKISRETIGRMASFKRHQQNKDVPYDEGCGGIMWDAWGGASGINWAINKMKTFENE